MSGMNTLASTALGITETMQGFIEARSTVFSLLEMQKTGIFLIASNYIHSHTSTVTSVSSNNLLPMT